MLHEENIPSLSSPSTSLENPQNIIAELSQRVFMFQKPLRARLEHGCVDITRRNIKFHGDTMDCIIPALEEFIDGQPTRNDTPIIRDFRFVTAIDAVINFQLPVRLDSPVPASESFFSHELWAPLLKAAVSETQSLSNWEVLCRQGREHGKGKMLTDFGAYTVIDGLPYYMLLAEIERGEQGDMEDTVHKDFVMLAAEMRIILSKNAQRIMIEDIDDLCIYGFLLTQTSARLLVMKAAYNYQHDELMFNLLEDVARFDFSSTRPLQQLIEDIVDFFSIVMLATGTEGTGISKERFNKPGRRLDCK
jgi:hypothetical protein